MPYQKVEFEFPDPDAVETSTEIEIEPSSEIEVDISGNEKPVAETEVEPEPEPEPEPELEIIDDTPEKDRNRTPSEPPEAVTKEELDNYSDKVRNRIQHFSKGYHDERREKEAAQRERDELEQAMRNVLAENKNLKDTVTQNQETLLTQAKSTVETELAAARNSIKKAHEEGDSEALVKAQEHLTNIALKKDSILKLEQESLQSQQNQVQDNTNVQPQVNRPPPDPKAVAWKEKNTWFGGANYQPETAFALGLHKEITEVEQISADSEEYYEKLNSRMQEKFPELFEGTNEQEVKAPAAKPRNVVAPATRSTAPKKIRLTQTQVALAKRLGLTPAQYAKQVAIDMRNNNG
tara:strand:- start:716 stop:1765 length:1050 start_codon:yes stop_codon:yes gene_type:complete